MNFRLLTTRGHPLITWTLALHYCCTSPRTTIPIIHCTDDTHTHTAVCTDYSWFPSDMLLKPWTSSCFLPSIFKHLSQSLLIANLRSLPCFLILVLPSLFICVLIIAFVFLDCPFILPFGLCMPLFGLLLVYSDYSFCQALWILVADRWPTHALRILLCLVFNIPVN